MIICALVKHKLMHIRAPILYSITVDSIKFNKITKTVSSFQNLGPPKCYCTFTAHSNYTVHYHIQCCNSL